MPFAASRSRPSRVASVRSVSVAVAVAGVAGVACLAIAAWLVGRHDGDRRAFAVVVAACIIASPIVWPNYSALLFVPIAVTWPRLAAAWFFGYAAWLVGARHAQAGGDEVCCRPRRCARAGMGVEPYGARALVAAGTMLVSRRSRSWWPARTRGSRGAPLTLGRISTEGRA